MTRSGPPGDGNAVSSARMWVGCCLALLPPVFVVYLSAVGTETNMVIVWSVLFIPSILIGLALVYDYVPWRRLASVLAAAIAIIASVIWTHWPLRATFAISRPGLERMVDRLESGQHIGGPEWAGLFYVRKAEINSHGMPCLWINLHPTGYTGFARPSDGVALGKYNDWSDYHLWAKWHLIAED